LPIYLRQARDFKCHSCKGYDWRVTPMLFDKTRVERRIFEIFEFACYSHIFFKEQA